MFLKAGKIKKFLKKLPWILAERAFLTCLFLFLFALIAGGLLAYKYIVLLEKADLGNLNQPFLLREKDYKEMLEVWKKEEEKFREADFKEFPDPFAVPLPSLPEEE